MTPILKNSIRSIAPEWMLKAYQRIVLGRHAKLLTTMFREPSNLEALVDALLHSKCFPAEQKRSEILALLKILSLQPPAHLCEIGGKLGGSLFLFSRVAAPNAKILSIDLDYSPNQIRIYQTFGKEHQHITCLRADSHAPETLQEVRNWLGNHPLDFLFIDGDHTMSGVSSDFAMYSQLMRPGGIIAFHDIVPDYRTSRGIGTQTYTGEVPLFWNDLKLKGMESKELIEDPGQDGYGIGVITWPKAAT